MGELILGAIMGGTISFCGALIAGLPPLIVLAIG